MKYHSAQQSRRRTYGHPSEKPSVAEPAAQPPTNPAHQAYALLPLQHHLIFTLEILSPFSNRITVRKKTNQHEAIERREEFGPGSFSRLRLRDQREYFAHAHHGSIDRGHRHQRIQVHPGWQHSLYALRQNDVNIRLIARIPEAFRAFPLARWH